MIHDRIANAALYAGASPRLAAAFAFLSRGDVAALPPGRYPIEGDDVFALVQTYDTRDPEPRRFETHRRYVDVQYLAEGSERIGLADPATLRCTEPYDAAKDAEFLTGQGVDVPLSRGQFMVLYPHEAHQPCLHPDDRPVPVRKIVVKVRAEA